jgi:hypothetical protein
MKMSRPGSLANCWTSLETEGVDAAFVYTFAPYDLPHCSASHEDFDMASKGVVN